MAKASSKSVSRQAPLSKPASKLLRKAPAKKAPAARKPLPKTAVKAIAKAKPAPAKKPAARPQVTAGKWVFTFGDGRAEGKSAMRDLLGGKGANLAEMANLGLPVPPGFTIPTSVCNYFYDNNKTYPNELKAQVEKALELCRQADRQDVRRRGQSAAGVGAFRRARLDARHDGYRAQPRPQRRDGGGAGRALRRQALRL